jgi:hypothetical protein
MMLENRATDDSTTIDMPRTTAAPLVLAVGILLVAMGIATSLIFILVGAIVSVA